jgi:hypothetical protein
MSAVGSWFLATGHRPPAAADHYGSNSMYRAPPPLNDTPQREHLRRLVLYYALLSGAGIGYVIAGLIRLIGLAGDAGSALIWFGAIGAFLTMYAPFLRTAGMSLPRWIVHMRRLIIAAGLLLAGFGILFALGGVALPTLNGSFLILACTVVSVSTNLRFVGQRLELL